MGIFYIFYDIKYTFLHFFGAIWQFFIHKSYLCISWASIRYTYWTLCAYCEIISVSRTTNEKKGLMMKIKPSSKLYKKWYAAIKSAASIMGDDKIDQHLDVLKKRFEGKNLNPHMTLRWDVYHLTSGSYNLPNLYNDDSINDNHVDTMLKHIFKGLSLPTEV